MQMTIRTVPETSRSDIGGVTNDTRAVDPVHLAAELEVRLKEQGFPPGLGYRQAALVDVMRLALAALDIPSTEDAGDPFAETRRVVRRVRILGGAR